MYRALPEYWLQESWRMTRVHTQGIEITCRIFEQLKHYAQEGNVEIYILIQYGRISLQDDLKIVDKALPCDDQDSLILVDTRNSLAELETDDIDKYESFFDGRMTREGNYFIASILWEAIVSSQ